jgi:transcriptional regulator with XRE-family HTH domain
MRLRDWLKKKKMTPDQFAAGVGASRGGVLKWISGERFPRPAHLAAVFNFTKGMVTANDFVQQISER